MNANENIIKMGVCSDGNCVNFQTPATKNALVWVASVGLVGMGTYGLVKSIEYDSDWAPFFASMIVVGIGLGAHHYLNS